MVPQQHEFHVLRKLGRSSTPNEQLQTTREAKVSEESTIDGDSQEDRRSRGRRFLRGRPVLVFARAKQNEAPSKERGALQIR